MPRPSVATGLASRASRLRRVVHVLAGVGGWVAFVVLAVWQLGFYAPRGVGADLIALAACGAAFMVIGLAWVRWNQSIYRRRHSRTSALVKHVDFSHDTLGRQITAPPGIREAPGWICISIEPESGRKSYRALVAQRAAAPAVDEPERVA
jgi:hypothetical protein